MAKRGKRWSHHGIGEGDIVAGKYRADSVLGVGGMGVVLQATHLVLKDRVALKILQEGASKEAAERFLREAQAAARIKSPHVARVVDVGTLEGGVPYIVMEYLEGRDLARVLQAHGALPVEAAVGYVLQACEALAAAHALGVIHRDIKPSNLFLSRGTDGTPLIKVVDFGVSKQTRASEYSSLTGVESTIGTPSYMSPEQVKSSKSVDVRADIWSLGVVLYELLTGQVPFDADSLAGLVALLVDPSECATRVREHRDDVPQELDDVVARCLEKNPDRRYADVSAMARALAPCGGPDGVESAARTARVLTASKPDVRSLISDDTDSDGGGSSDTSTTSTEDFVRPPETGTAFSRTRWPWTWPRRPRDLAAWAIPAIAVGFAVTWTLRSLTSSTAPPDGTAEPSVSATLARSAPAAAPPKQTESPRNIDPAGFAERPQALQIEDLPVDVGERAPAASARPPVAALAKSAAPGGSAAHPFARFPPVAPSAAQAPRPPAAPPSKSEDDILVNPYR